MYVYSWIKCNWFNLVCFPFSRTYICEATILFERTSIFFHTECNVICLPGYSSIYSTCNQATVCVPARLFLWKVYVSTWEKIWVRNTGGFGYWIAIYQCLPACLKLGGWLLNYYNLIQVILLSNLWDRPQMNNTKRLVCSKLFFLYPKEILVKKWD